MTAEKGRRAVGGRRGVRRVKGQAAAPETAKDPERERTLVDIDPWAVLLEGLLEMPAEDEPTTHERAKGK